MRLLIGTNNAGKCTEIADVLRGLPVTIVTPKDLGVGASPDETGATFRDNALIKARFYAKQSNLPTIADDSGIEVEALKDELGLHTRRWGAGPGATDAEWIAVFLRRMQKEKNRRARFVCVLAYIDAERKEHVFEGACAGVITDRLEADYLPGLPISACFKPNGYDCVFSALNLEQKNSTSHRGRAAHALREYLTNHLK